MTSRWVTPPNFGSMAIAALEIVVLVYSRQLLAHVQAQTVLVVTFSAGCDGNVWFQTAQRGRLCDVDVTGCAFRNMLLARVSKVERNSSWPLIDWEVRLVGKLVTTGAVIAGGLLRFPVAVETRRMSCRHGFEGGSVGDIGAL